MIETLLIIFVCLSPLLGKNLDYTESLIFYGFPLFFYLLILTSKIKTHSLPRPVIAIQVILILLYGISTLLSVNKGISYYHFFQFFNTLFIVNLVFIVFPNRTNFEKTFLFTSLFMVFIFSLNYFHVINLPDKSLGDNFIKQVWGHSYLSELLIISIPLSLKYVLGNSKKYLFLFLALLIALLFTNSRIAIITIFFSLLFLVIVTKSFVIKTKIIFLLPILLVVLFGIFFFISKGVYSNKTLDGSRLEYWSEAFNYFLESPLIGNGPDTFETANNRYHQSFSTKTSLAHSSLLTFLSENGILFTLIIFTSLIVLLRPIFHQDIFLFTALSGSIVASLIDSSWNTIGIFLIVLTSLTLSKPSPPPNRQSKILIYIQFIILSLFFLSKTASDLLFIFHQYRFSYYADPFNPNPRLALIEENPMDTSLINSTLTLFEKDNSINQKIANNLPLSQSTSLQYHLIALNPIDTIKPYLSLFLYYQQQQQIDNYKYTLSLFDRNIGLKYISLDITPISSALYSEALNIWTTDRSSAIYFLNQAVKYSPDWSHLRIELANAYMDDNQILVAKNEIQACLSRSIPRFHCQQYASAKQPGNFGTLSKEIILR